jgi:hypothetical protein
MRINNIDEDQSNIYERKVRMRINLNDLKTANDMAFHFRRTMPCPSTGR